MALLKPHHTTYYHSLRLIMSSRFFIPTHGLFLSSVSPTPPSLFLKPRSNLGVRTLLTNRVLVPSVLVPPRSSFISSASSGSVAEVKKGKEGPDHYESDNIQILEGLDAVRKRPGMYIGSTGLHHLVYEILDNTVDETQAGFASKVDIVLLADGSVCITDNGRGIPINLHPGSKKSGVETVLQNPIDFYQLGLTFFYSSFVQKLEVTVWRDCKEC